MVFSLVGLGSGRADLLCRLWNSWALGGLRSTLDWLKMEELRVSFGELAVQGFRGGYQVVQSGACGEV